MNKFNKLYEDIFKPASAEEVKERKKLYELERFKDWCDINGVKYNVDDKGNIISFDKSTIDNKNEYGNTALIYAAKDNNMKIVKLLLDNGADVNARNNYGNTALIFTAMYDSINLAKLLLDNGVDVNVKNRDARTALMLAFTNKMRELLKQYGAKE